MIFLHCWLIVNFQFIKQKLPIINRYRLHCQKKCKHSQNAKRRNFPLTKKVHNYAYIFSTQLNSPDSELSNELHIILIWSGSYRTTIIFKVWREFFERQKRITPSHQNRIYSKKLNQNFIRLQITMNSNQFDQAIQQHLQDMVHKPERVAAWSMYSLKLVWWLFVIWRAMNRRIERRPAR